jgi:DNA-binding NarL/FixJ family response regulator
MEPIRILIADDHALFRSGLQALLDSLADTAVIAQAATGTEAVTLATQYQPDVVLMDIQMPTPDGSGMNGIEATRRIVHTSPHIGVIIITMFEDDDSVFAAMRAGARGYVLKGADQDEMLRTVRAVARGEALFGVAIATRLMNFFATPVLDAPTPLFPDLTDREREVLDLIAQGNSNNDIARHLVISPKTVSNHISNIFNKLHVADRAQAIVLAREAGLGREK